MNKQDTKVKHVEVSKNHTPPTSLRSLHSLLLHSTSSRVHALHHNETRNTSGQAVSPRHSPVTQVVDVTRKTPPAGDHELGAALGLDVLEILAAGVVGVGAETILLVVGTAEDRVADCGDAEDHCETLEAELEREHGEVAGLEVVDEGHPDEVSEGKHEAEAVHDDVHGGQKRGLHVKTVQDIEGLEDGDQDYRVGDVAIFPVLAGNV